MRIFYDHTIRIKRMKGSGSGKQTLVSTATAEASIQPLGKERQQFQEGVYGQTFVACCDDWIPVQKGDRVVDQNNVAYAVTEVTVRDYGSFPYKELILKKTT